MYIRTKNRIYKVESKTCDKQGYYIEGYEYDVILKDQVINQSENLDELCDEFVKIWNNTNLLPELLEYDEQYEEEKENMKYVYPKGNITIYGAIWTEWGLKYVAKMNDKGELKLI